MAGHLRLVQPPKSAPNRRARRTGNAKEKRPCTPGEKLARAALACVTDYGVFRVPWKRLDPAHQRHIERILANRLAKVFSRQKLEQV